jgi:hypothetical protein
MSPAGGRLDAAQEAHWAKQIAAFDSKADNAEGLAAAMSVTVKQLEAQLQQQQQTLATKDGELRAGHKTRQKAHNGNHNAHCATCDLCTCVSLVTATLWSSRSGVGQVCMLP